MTNTNDGYLLIGDIHSQFAPLKKAWDYACENNLRPILLGDVFDSRCEVSNTVDVYRLLQYMQKHGDAVILRSNHQDKLEMFSLGIPCHQPVEMLRTADEFEAAGIDLLEVNAWLQTMPYGFVFRDHENTEFRCAHAFFPSWLQIPDYIDSIEVRPTQRQVRKLMLYGPPLSEGKGRALWWLNASKKRDWVRVGGHYHTIYQDRKSLLLDGGCGGLKRSWFCSEAPILVAYDSLKKQMIEIEC
jgi:hypothetical protein